MTHHELDVRYLLCPMPVIRTQTRVAELSVGDVLAITATDRGSLVDIPAWCRVHGHRVIETSEIGGEIRILVQVGAS